MLKNIQLHLEQNDEKQEIVEAAFAQKLTATHHNNINTFQRNIPSLLPIIQQSHTTNIALFVNKFGSPNIVDYGSGRTLYGLDPESEILGQVTQFQKHAPCIHLNGENTKPLNKRDKGFKSLEAYAHYLAAESAPDTLDTLVVFGLGLGSHLNLLLQKHTVKHLIVYEPEEQYFRCSALINDWNEIFTVAKSQGTAVFIQIGKDGRDIIDNVEELRSHFDIDKLFIYQHYHHPIFDDVIRQLQSTAWGSVKESGLRLNFKQDHHSFIPKWTPPVDLQAHLDPEDVCIERFENNLQALKTYFPEIYESFKDYKPQKWFPIATSEGEINLLERDTLATWYGQNVRSECKTSAEGFSKHPHKDGLVLGYNGEKLKHYLHYQFVKKTETLLNETVEEQGELPEIIKSLIIFGLGSGYQLESLLQNRTIEKLFICEPNRDFFYASLFAIDWADIFETIDSNSGRIYINIGDDGTNLFKDLLNQFYSIGPYILANTYFYQGYFNNGLVDAIAQLREQLSVVISMGEYFDHASYGIAHTLAGIQAGLPHLKNKPASLLSGEDKDLPVFFVGNGPSLDSAIEYLKEYQDKVLIVSCGTSLQVLHKNNIVPDFHAEIEQNRSTFDWISRIDDFAYLKQVRLLSCNGIHPDTASLFADTFVAFKEGESSTVSTLQVLGESDYQVLQFAFPTVTNFAVNLFTSAGFHQLYLIGVDLGFADADKHHSRQSGYYDEQGNPLFDYKTKNNAGLVVKGNFRKTVFTKHEFKVAKMILEQGLAQQKTDCYNTSDGALIAGAKPLDLVNVLVTTTEQQKQKSIHNFTEKCFIRPDSGTTVEKYHEKYKNRSLVFELDGFTNLIEQQVTSVEEAESVIEKQKEMLFASYQNGASLLFYYLYGTVNYANALLSKLMAANSDPEVSVEMFNKGFDEWRACFSNIKDRILKRQFELDASTSISQRRLMACMRKNLKGKSIQVCTNSQSFMRSVNEQAEWYGIDVDISFVTVEQLQKTEHVPSDTYLIVYIKPDLAEAAISLPDAKLSLFEQTLILDSDPEYSVCDSAPLKMLVRSQLQSDIHPVECNDAHIAQLALQHVTGMQSSNVSFIVPKYSYSEKSQLENVLQLDAWKEYECYDLGWSIGFAELPMPESTVLANGSRTRFLGHGAKIEYWKDGKLTSDQFSNRKEQLRTLLPYLLEDEVYV